MRYIMRRSCLFLVMIAVIVFTGCGQKKKEDPVTVTLWHVYGGLVNKNIVAGLQARGVNALGLTGADMDVIR